MVMIMKWFQGLARIEWIAGTFLLFYTLKAKTQSLITCCRIVAYLLEFFMPIQLFLLLLLLHAIRLLLLLLLLKNINSWHFLYRVNDK